jgi:hypothetical protein
MTDRDDLLATMYDDDTVVSVPIQQNDLRTRKIRVGVVEYEVPTVEYMRHLEQRLTQQSEMINQQRRVISRIEAILHGTRTFVRRHSDSIGDMRQELSRKVDHS